MSLRFLHYCFWKMPDFRHKKKRSQAKDFRYRVRPLFRISLVVRIAVGVHALPAGGVCAHSVEVTLRLPVEDARRLRGVGVALRDIAGAAIGDAVLNGSAPCLTERADDLENGISVAGTDIDGIGAVHLCRIVERLQMCEREVDDMDVVTHARTVGCGIIVAEDVDALELPAATFAT